MSNENSPIFVDLDYTLIATDMLVESALDSAKHAPRSLLRSFAALRHGRSQMKSELAMVYQGDATTLPYREEVLRFIRDERNKGRKIILATATHHRIASRIASHLGLFDDVLASTDTVNLKGAHKLKAIQDYCEANRFSGFEYIGDSRSDLAIWEHSKRAYVVSPARGVVGSLAELNVPTAQIESKSNRWRALVRCLRPHQWMKNGLIFVPLVVGHELLNASKLLLCFEAAVVFSLVASSIYVINDLFDLSSDRQHPRKRSRPFASGALPITYGPILSAGLLLSGFGVAFALLPIEFLLLLGLYFTLNLGYTLWLKSKVIIDVILLAGMYNLRVLAGGAASGIAISDWLLAFGMSIFTSLAFAKRYSELSRLASKKDLHADAGHNEGNQSAKGRGYHTGDLAMVGSLGPAAGLISVLILSLYVSSEQVQTLYQNERYLLLICPLLLYWISRLWIITGRGELSEDPVAYAVTDWRSWTVAIVGLVAMFCAR
ncbi:MAG: UbiA family prenyltransferase [Planctomycetota bacterium]